MVLNSTKLIEKIQPSTIYYSIFVCIKIKGHTFNSYEPTGGGGGVWFWVLTSTCWKIICLDCIHCSLSISLDFISTLKVNLKWIPRELVHVLSNSMNLMSIDGSFLGNNHRKVCAPNNYNVNSRLCVIEFFFLEKSISHWHRVKASIFFWNRGVYMATICLLYQLFDSCVETCGTIVRETNSFAWQMTYHMHIVSIYLRFA